MATQEKLVAACSPIGSICNETPAIAKLENLYGSYLEKLDSAEKLCLIATISNHLACYLTEADEENKISLPDSYYQVHGAIPVELEEMLAEFDQLNGAALARLMLATNTFLVHTHWEEA
jgi:hypothetical protein